MDSALDKLKQGGFSVGLELPLDNDWTMAGQAANRASARVPGEPDMRRHAELAKLADRLGYRALWVRDVPLYDPAFGDAAQVFEAFTYLGYLAGVTQEILLGTAAVVLPLREPVLTLKSAASVDQLSGGRLLLGVASGDRPVEYPVFGRDFDTRGAAFREQVAMVHDWGAAALPPGVALLPRPAQMRVPLLVAGLAQQTPEWVGAHMDGCLAYPGMPHDHQRRAAAWRAVAGPDKPYISFFHLDLAEDPDAPMRYHRFGGRVGRKGLLLELEALQAAGVQHMGLHLRQNQRPVAEAMQEIAEFVLPRFHGPAQPLAA
ncbi:TIGR03571 family LLM class oxidoreductase [Pseudoduganella aquatica]|uniref:TIGR03571 family LLM class oxidoreductase n=1 Tax=Pseudoduganella aquatica TaxID=2660641 RepID=A0A7X4HGP4_9BURK|nr:TIGR03571 family LLM class oxidoreductase [Pseudoduganella aquatica]MYN09830.1 TIGR03571 family LLM class oxidoreductase [Pseudoduganella aquatica]